jgi:hypothetical protein
VPSKGLFDPPEPDSPGPVRFHVNLLSTALASLYRQADAPIPPCC